MGLACLHCVDNGPLSTHFLYGLKKHKCMYMKKGFWFAHNERTERGNSSANLSYEINNALG